MFRRRLTRVIAPLVLLLAQAAPLLPYRLVGETVTAHAQMAGGVPHEECHHGAAGAMSHASAPCGSCPAPMPSQSGGCDVDSASCGATSATCAVASLGAAVVVSAFDAPPAIVQPAARDFIPDPPPPRA